MKEYYILVANDSENKFGKKIPAADVIKQRMQNKQWEIYRGTKFKDFLKTGDVCIFYSAGRKTGSQKFLGEGEIKNIHVSPICVAEYLNQEEPLKYVEFSKIKAYKVPVSIREKLDLLSFIPENRQKWGMVFMNGCRKILEEDYKAIASG
jgi:hypothetical protein